GLLVLRASSDLQADQTPEVTLHGTTVARFASQEQARELLTEHDAFLSSLSQVDRDVRLSRADVTPEQFVDHVRIQARSWETEPQERIAGLLRNIAGKLERLTLPLPPHAWLVRTSGLEEAEAAYCRGNVIVLPEKID